jgi:uncharacterized membrane protein
MNVTFKGGDMEGFAVLAVIFGIVTAILWLVIGWRAMRAHERVADAHERLAEALGLLASSFRADDKR